MMDNDLQSLLAMMNQQPPPQTQQAQQPAQPQDLWQQMLTNMQQSRQSLGGAGRSNAGNALLGGIRSVMGGGSFLAGL